MTTKIAIRDLPRHDTLSKEATRNIRGGIAEGFLFRGRPQGSIPQLNTFVTIGELNVNNNYIDTAHIQNNTLNQLSIVNAKATGGSTNHIEVVQDLGASNTRS